MAIEISAFFYVKYFLSYACENLQQPVKERVNGELERA